jgi:CO/xanthine dehydrogenase FAD-binding subunit
MAAANAALAGAKPLSQNKYKITLAKVAVKRAIMNCLLVGGVVGGAAQ